MIWLRWAQQHHYRLAPVGLCWWCLPISVEAFWLLFKFAEWANSLLATCSIFQASCSVFRRMFNSVIAPVTQALMPYIWVLVLVHAYSLDRQYCFVKTFWCVYIDESCLLGLFVHQSCHATSWIILSLSVMMQNPAFLTWPFEMRLNVIVWANVMSLKMTVKVSLSTRVKTHKSLWPKEQIHSPFSICTLPLWDLKVLNDSQELHIWLPAPESYIHLCFWLEYGAGSNVRIVVIIAKYPFHIPITFFEILSTVGFPHFPLFWPSRKFLLSGLF